MANSDGLDWIAWEMATSADSWILDASNAVSLAEKNAAQTSRTNASILDSLAAVYAQAGQFTNAVTTMKDALALNDPGFPREALTQRLSLYEASIPLRETGGLDTRAYQSLKAGNFTEAEAAARDRVRIGEKIYPDDWRTFNAQSLLGGSLLGQKKFAEAEPLLRSGYYGMKQRADKLAAIGRLRLKEAGERLVRLYEATNRPDEAAKMKKSMDEPTPSASK